MGSRTHAARWIGGVLACVVHGGCFEEAEPNTVGDTGTGTTAGSTGADPTNAGMDASTGGTMPGETSGSAPSTGEPPSTTAPADDTTDAGDDDTSTGAGSVCGNGVEEPPLEMCDGTPGCLDDCTFEDYDCNPLSNATCAEGLRCGLVDAPTEDFACMLPGGGAVGDACFGASANDEDCADGLTCLFNINTPLCDSGNCCVEYCDLLGRPTCSGEAVCRPFFVNPMYMGLEHVGFCGDPL